MIDGNTKVALNVDLDFCERYAEIIKTHYEDFDLIMSGGCVWDGLDYFCDDRAVQMLITDMQMAYAMRNGLAEIYKDGMLNGHIISKEDKERMDNIGYPFYRLLEGIEGIPHWIKCTVEDLQKENEERYIFEKLKNAIDRDKYDKTDATLLDTFGNALKVLKEYNEKCAIHNPIMYLYNKLNKDMENTKDLLAGVIAEYPDLLISNRDVERETVQRMFTDEEMQNLGFIPNRHTLQLLTDDVSEIKLFTSDTDEKLGFIWGSLETEKLDTDNYFHRDAKKFFKDVLGIDDYPGGSINIHVSFDEDKKPNKVSFIFEGGKDIKTLDLLPNEVRMFEKLVEKAKPFFPEKGEEDPEEEIEIY